MAFLDDGELQLVLGSLETHEADVVLAIVARGLYGPTRTLVDRLDRPGSRSSELERLQRGDLAPGQSLLVEAHGAISARYALFVGAPDVRSVTYADISDFARNAIDALDRGRVRARSIALVAHGPGFGLDGIEAFLASVGGWLSAVREGALPSLERVTYVEASPRKLDQLGEALVKARSSGEVPAQEPVRDRASWVFRFRDESARELRSPIEDLASDSKRHVFVAMPFAEAFDDIFYFGISGPVRSRGFVCERMDKLFFTGDVVAQMRRKIEGADLVIAELTGSNPNVYLEIGYAWGQGKPTILLIKKASKAKFDVAGQQCLIYRNIKHLSESLEEALDAFADAMR